MPTSSLHQLSASLVSYPSKSITSPALEEVPKVSSFLFSDDIQSKPLELLQLMLIWQEIRIKYYCINRGFFAAVTDDHCGCWTLAMLYGLQALRSTQKQAEFVVPLEMSISSIILFLGFGYCWEGRKKDEASFLQMDRIKFLNLGLFIAQHNSLSYVVMEVNGLLQKHCVM